MGNRTPPRPPHWRHDFGYPPSGPNRYRLVKRGLYFRVEEFCSRWWSLGYQRWRPLRSRMWKFSNTSEFIFTGQTKDRLDAIHVLSVCRSHAFHETAATWTPDEDAS